MVFVVSDRQAIIFFCSIAVLVAANLFFLMNPNTQENKQNSSYYKTFAVQTNATLLEMKVNAQKLEIPDLNENQKALFGKMKESLLADMDWLQQKEKPINEQLLATSNPLQANELLKKEMAVFAASNYVFGLNNNAILDALSGLIDENETIEEAKAAMEWTEVIGILNDDFATEFIQQTAINKNEIQEETIAIMEEYLELRKTKFLLAKSRDSIFAEATKFLELSILLEANSSG